MGELIEGAMQQAPQPERHCMATGDLVKRDHGFYGRRYYLHAARMAAIQLMVARLGGAAARQ